MMRLSNGALIGFFPAFQTYWPRGNNRLVLGERTIQVAESRVAVGWRELLAVGQS